MLRFVPAVLTLAACSHPPKHPDPFLSGGRCGEVAYYYASADVLVDDSTEYCGGVMGTFYTDYQDNSAIGDSLFFDAWNRDNDIYFTGPIMTFEVDISELVDGNEYDGNGGAAFWLDENADVRDIVGVSSGHVRVERSEVDGFFEDTYWLLEWDVTWGDPTGAGPWYTATGYDWVWFTTG